MNAQTGTIARVHADERRVISEFNGTDMSVQAFEVFASDLPLGKHFHRRKREVFIIQEGTGQVLLAPVDIDGNCAGAVEKISLQNGTVIVIDPWMAHTFYLEPGTKMVCVSSAPFNPDDMDMSPANWLVR